LAEAQEFGANNRQKRRKAVLVVDQCIRKSRFRLLNPAGTHNQVDMRDFITFANKRLANKHLIIKAISISSSNIFG